MGRVGARRVIRGDSRARSHRTLRAPGWHVNYILAQVEAME
jgi:hypothetical protein